MVLAVKLMIAQQTCGDLENQQRPWLLYKSYWIWFWKNTGSENPGYYLLSFRGQHGMYNRWHHHQYHAPPATSPSSSSSSSSLSSSSSSSAALQPMQVCRNKRPPHCSFFMLWPGPSLNSPPLTMWVIESQGPKTFQLHVLDYQINSGHYIKYIDCTKDLDAQGSRLCTEEARPWQSHLQYRGDPAWTVLCV